MQRPGNDDLLLIIDVQNDFCPGGALAVADGDAVVPVINRLAERFFHVAVTQDWHPSGHSSFATSHPGANLCLSEIKHAHIDDGVRQEMALAQCDQRHVLFAASARPC